MEFLSITYLIIFFFLTCCFGDTFVWCRKNWASLFICRQLSAFTNNSSRIYLVKLKIGILYHIENTSRHNFSEISIPETLNGDKWLEGTIHYKQIKLRLTKILKGLFVEMENAAIWLSTSLYASTSNAWYYLSGYEWIQ